MTMTTREKTQAVILAAVAALAALPPAAAIAHDWDADAQATTDASLAAEDLEALARLFSEAPVAVTFNAALAEVPCGEEGHCNYVDCSIDCEPDQFSECTCAPTGGKCQDDHTWWDPFDDDQHTAYTCKCACSDPPSDCLVKVGGVCIISSELDIQIRPGSKFEPQPW